MANVLGVKTNIGIRLIIALIKGLEFGLNIVEKSWKSFGKSLEKMCGNPEMVMVGYGCWRHLRPTAPEMCTTVISHCSDSSVTVGFIFYFFGGVTFS